MGSLRQKFNSIYYGRKIGISRTPITRYAEKIKESEPFSFSRFGDGEWMATFGTDGRNCDGHEFFPEMTEQLREALMQPGKYYFGIQNYAVRKMGRRIHRFLKTNSIRISWHEADMLHYANIGGELFPLIDALKNKNVVVIGPGYLRGINPDILSYAHFIEVPRKNCFLSINEIEREIITYAEKRSNVVFAFSASMATNCMIHHLFPVIGTSHWMIDFGSIWDGYVGMDSRSYQTKFNWDDLLKKNTTPRMNS